ncbi:MAG: MFS transporter [Nitrososphaerota archaeon]|nr:MFS transporter [Nitrososphaerota archaeon]MDG7020526.1 MFS transporter [Nitrososphaerota archaeon]
MQALAKQRKWLSLAAVNIGNFAPPFDTGVMSLILPTISIGLKAPVTLVLWVPIESLVLTAAFQPIFGRFSDGHGRRRYFLLGLVLFSIFAYLSGNSQTIYELFIYRFFQSLGGAFILSNGRALIADAFEGRQRGFALGTHISTIYVAQTVGVAITGSIVTVTASVGWRYVFYAEAAVAAIAFPVSLIVLRESSRNLKVRTDWLGAIFFAGGLGPGIVALTAYSNQLSNISFYFQQFSVPFLGLFLPTLYVSIPTVYIVVVGLASTALFVLRESTARQPLLDFHTFRTNTLFRSTNLSVLFVYMAHYGTLILLSFYLEIIKEVNPLTAGLVLTVEPLTVTIFALFGGWIASRTPSREPAVAGLVIVTFSLLLLSTTGVATPITTVAFLIAMLGAGVGIFAPSNTNANLGSVPPGDRATANGILGMMRSTGQSVSLAIGSALIGLYLFGKHLSGAFRPDQFMAAIDLYFVVGAALAAVAIFFAFRGREAREPTRAPG